MFHIFQKKRFLIDGLNGVVDSPNHSLRGIEDGGKTVEGTLTLVKSLEELGVRRLVATPHIMHNY